MEYQRTDIESINGPSSGVRQQVGKNRWSQTISAEEIDSNKDAKRNDYDDYEEQAANQHSYGRYKVRKPNLGDLSTKINGLKIKRKNNRNMSQHNSMLTIEHQDTALSTLRVTDHS